MRKWLSPLAFPSPTLCHAEWALDQCLCCGHAHGKTLRSWLPGRSKKLSRDELQGVIGHETSHILQQDTRLNGRLLMVLGGIWCWARWVGCWWIADAAVYAHPVLIKWKLTRPGRPGPVCFGYLGVSRADWFKRRSRDSGIPFRRGGGAVHPESGRIGWCPESDSDDHWTLLSQTVAAGPGNQSHVLWWKPFIESLDGLSSAAGPAHRRHRPPVQNKGPHPLEPGQGEKPEAKCQVLTRSSKGWPQALVGQWGAAQQDWAQSVRHPSTQPIIWMHSVTRHRIPDWTHHQRRHRLGIYHWCPIQVSLRPGCWRPPQSLDEPERRRIFQHFQSLAEPSGGLARFCYTAYLEHHLLPRKRQDEPCIPTNPFDWNSHSSCQSLCAWTRVLPTKKTLFDDLARRWFHWKHSVFGEKSARHPCGKRWNASIAYQRCLNLRCWTPGVMRWPMMIWLKRKNMNYWGWRQDAGLPSAAKKCSAVWPRAEYYFSIMLFAMEQFFHCGIRLIIRFFRWRVTCTLSDQSSAQRSPWYLSSLTLRAFVPCCAES